MILQQHRNSKINNSTQELIEYENSVSAVHKISGKSL